MRISVWSSDVCSSDLGLLRGGGEALGAQPVDRRFDVAAIFGERLFTVHHACARAVAQFLDESGRNFSHGRSEEHTSELQSLMRISYAVFCLKKKQYIDHILDRVQNNKNDSITITDDKAKYN